jgi:hypothetical protein
MPLNSYTIVIVLELALKDTILMKDLDNVNLVIPNVKPVLVLLNNVVKPVQMDLISITTNVSFLAHMDIMKMIPIMNVPLVTIPVVIVTEDNPINVLNVVKEDTYTKDLA